MKKIIGFICLFPVFVQAGTDIEIRTSDMVKPNSQETQVIFEEATLIVQKETFQEADTLVPLYKNIIEALIGKASFTIISQMVQQGMDVNQADSYGRTPLMIAVANNRLDIVQYLINQGANLNKQDMYQNSALIIACSMDKPNEDIIKLLVQKGAQLYDMDLDHKNALEYAFQNPNMPKSTIRFLKMLPKRNFLSLIEKATPEQVEQALKNGAKADDNGLLGVTPLMMAAAKNTHPEVIKILLENGAKINATDPNGSTALFYAIKQNKNPEIIELLLKRGSATHFTDKRGKKASFYAKLRKDLPQEIIDKLGE